MKRIEQINKILSHLDSQHIKVDEAEKQIIEIVNDAFYAGVESGRSLEKKGM